MRKNLTITAERNTQIINISFDSTSPQLARTVPNTLAKLYIESDLEAKLVMTNKAAFWLNKRLSGLREQLTQSEQKLQKYIEDQGLVNVTGVKTIAIKQIEETAAELVHARIKLTQIKNVYKQVKNLRIYTIIKTFESIPAIFNHSLLQSLKQIELDTEKKVSELKERYGPKHPRFVAAKAELKAAKEHTVEQIKKAVVRIKKEYELASANVRALERSLEENKKRIREINRKEYKLGVLEREVKVQRQLYEMFLTRFKETDASQDVQALQSTIGRIIEEAVIPLVAYKPKIKLIVMISLVLGFMFSTLLAFLLDYLNNTLKDAEDVEQKLGLSLLGNLPKVKANKEKLTPIWMFLKEPQSQFCESIRTVRTGIMLSSLDISHKILVVTSSIPGEGKTTLATSQAFALGQIAKTLLIDADMRRPSIAQLLELSKETPGLSNLVANTHTFDDCVHHLNEEDGGIDAITSGMIPPNPLELLSSEQFKEILNQLIQQYTYIVIDTAPTLLVSDALVLAKQANILLYVVKANETPYQVVQEGLKRLQQVKVPVHNIVLNQIDTKQPSKYYYGKYHYYKGYYGKHGYYTDAL